MAKLVLNTVLLAWQGGSEQEGRGGVRGRPLPGSLRVGAKEKLPWAAVQEPPASASPV